MLMHIHARIGIWRRPSSVSKAKAKPSGGTHKVGHKVGQSSDSLTEYSHPIEKPSLFCSNCPLVKCTQSRWLEDLRLKHEIRWHIDCDIQGVIVILFKLGRHSLLGGWTPGNWLEDNPAVLQLHAVLLTCFMGNLDNAKRFGPRTRKLCRMQFARNPMFRLVMRREGELHTNINCQG